MKSRTFITIPIRNEYYGRKPFKLGKLLTLTKEPDNIHDNEAIKVSVPGIDTVGYVANSEYTLIPEVKSASQIVHTRLTQAKVMFILFDEWVIAKLI